MELKFGKSRITKWIAALLGLLTGFIVGIMLMARWAGKHIDLLRLKVNKFEDQSGVLNAWLLMKRRGCDVLTLLREDCAHRVMLYGMDALGRQVIEEINECDDIHLVEVINSKREAYMGYISKTLDEVGDVDVDVIIINGDVDDETLAKLKSINDNTYTVTDLVYMCDWRKK